MPATRRRGRSRSVESPAAQAGDRSRAPAQCSRLLRLGDGPVTVGSSTSTEPSIPFGSLPGQGGSRSGSGGSQALAPPFCRNRVVDSRSERCTKLPVAPMGNASGLRSAPPPCRTGPVPSGSHRRGARSAAGRGGRQKYACLEGKLQFDVTWASPPDRPAGATPRTSSWLSRQGSRRRGTFRIAHASCQTRDVHLPTGSATEATSVAHLGEGALTGPQSPKRLGHHSPPSTRSAPFNLNVTSVRELARDCSRLCQWESLDVKATGLLAVVSAGEYLRRIPWPIRCLQRVGKQGTDRGPRDSDSRDERGQAHNCHCRTNQFSSAGEPRVSVGLRNSS